MGHQRATLTTDTAAISLNVYKEEDEEIDYERVIAQVEIETPDGDNYSNRKEVTDTSGDGGVLTALHTFLSNGADAKDVVEDALTEAVAEAESDLEESLQLDTTEIVHEFEQYTQKAT